MQISFSTTDHRAELKALTLMLGSLCGMTVIDPSAAAFTPDEIGKAFGVTDKPQPLPAADLPSTGTDTTQMGFAGGLVLPLAPAPAPLQQPLPNLGGAVELDAAGLPWDERIHSSTKGKTDKGVWKLRKGMGANPAFVSRIEAEIRATLPSATPAPTNVAPVFPPAAAVTTQPAPLQPLPLPLPAPGGAPVALQPLPAAAPAVAPAPTNMQEFMQQVAPLMQEGKVTADKINMACMLHNLPGMAALTTATPEQVGKVWAELLK